MHAYIHLFFRFPSHLGHHKSLSSVPCAVQQVLISYLVYTWSYGHVWGLPGGTRGKELTCQCRRCGFYPWVKKIPWKRKWQCTPVFLPGESYGQRAWRATVRRVAKSQPGLKWLSTRMIHVYIYLLYIVPRSTPVSQLIPHFSSPLGSHTFILCISVSISALSIIHPYHFSRFYIWVTLYDICFSLSGFREWTFEENTEASRAQSMLIEDQKDGVMKTKMSRKEQTVSLLKSRAVRLADLFSQAPFLERTAVRTLSWQAKVRTAMSEWQGYSQEKRGSACTLAVVQTVTAGGPRTTRLLGPQRPLGGAEEAKAVNLTQGPYLRELNLLPVISRTSRSP